MLVLAPIWLMPTPAKANFTFVKTVPAQQVEIKPIENVQPIESTVHPPSNTTANLPYKQRIKKKSGTSQKGEVKNMPTSGRSYSKEEVKTLIVSYSEQYGINPNMPLCIAEKESGFNQLSANKHSSAKGAFQYLDGTWKATDEGKAGLSVMDADANVKAAIKYMAIHKSTKPWVTAKNCPPLSLSK